MVRFLHLTCFIIRRLSLAGLIVLVAQLGPIAHGQGAYASKMASRASISVETMPLDGTARLVGPRANRIVVERQTASSSALNTSSPSSMPNLSVSEIVARTKAAIQKAGSYRFERAKFNEDGSASGEIGEVAINLGELRQPEDELGFVFYYYSYPDKKLYTRRADGTWSSGDLPDDSREELVSFLGLPAIDWTLQGGETSGGRTAYIIGRTLDFQGTSFTEALWVDPATFLPLQLIDQAVDNQYDKFETFYSDFGTPVDVHVPQDALDATNPEQQAATAEATADAQLSQRAKQGDPQALLSLLTSSPFGSDELPAGYTSAEVQAAQPGTAGTLGVPDVGAVAFFINGDENTLIMYLVFDNTAAARSGLEASSLALGRQGLVVAGGVPVPNDMSSRCLIGTLQGYLAAECIVQDNNALVFGISILSSPNAPQVMTNAQELVSSGVRHLMRLVQANGTALEEGVPASGMDTLLAKSSITG